MPLCGTNEEISLGLKMVGSGLAKSAVVGSAREKKSSEEFRVAEVDLMNLFSAKLAEVLECRDLPRPKRFEVRKLKAVADLSLAIYEEAEGSEDPVEAIKQAGEGAANFLEWVHEIYYIQKLPTASSPQAAVEATVAELVAA